MPKTSLKKQLFLFLSEFCSATYTIIIMTKAETNERQLETVFSKTITFVVPCFNSEAYMDTCIASLLECGDDIQIIIVNDGSQDRTAEKADVWAFAYPDIITAVHKENGGHGSAVNCGLSLATGQYFKVVDSDDWLDEAAMAKVMTYLRAQANRPNPTDLVVTNYVYEKVYEDNRKVMNCHNFFPNRKEISWSHMGPFNFTQYLHMHSVIYRAELLKQIDLTLPENCFYVDNVYVYTPLPHVRSIYYMDIDAYHYFIGREGQSVSVEAMYDRIDQHVIVMRRMIDSVHLPEDTPDKKLYNFMTNHMAMMMCVASVYLRMHDTEEDSRKLADLWDYLHFNSPELFEKVRRHPLAWSTNIPGRVGRQGAIQGFQITRKLFKFN